jgi:hypothetical protein
VARRGRSSKDMSEILKAIGSGLCVVAIIGLIFASMKKGGKNQHER